MGETRGLFIAQAGRGPAMYQVKQKKAPEAAVEGLAEREIGRSGSHTAQAVASPLIPKVLI